MLGTRRPKSRPGARQEGLGGLPGGEPGEPALHPVDLGEVATDVVVAAPLAGGEPEAALHVGVPAPDAAQVDDRGQVLLLPERGSDDPPALEGARDVTIEKRGG